MTLDEKLKLNGQCRECARIKHELDADCNDCLHFQRGAMEKQPGLTLFRGTCGRDGTAVAAYPNWFTGNSCYESRPKKTHTCVPLTRADFDEIFRRFFVGFYAGIFRYVEAMESHEPQSALDAIV